MSKVGFRCPECGATLIISGRHPPARPLNGFPIPDGKLLAIRVDDINWGKRLGARILNCFRTQGIETFADLLRYSEKELLRIDLFGRDSLQEVKQVLSNHGVHLGML